MKAEDDLKRLRRRPTKERPFDLESAISVATQAHRGQKDKAGQQYILHPIRVMMKQASEAAKMAAILHDVIEDTGWTLEGLRHLKCPEMVVEAVDALTHRNGESYAGMIERIRLNEIAVSVKIADLEDNMDIRRILNRRDLKDKDMHRLNKYLNAWTVLTGK